MINMWSNDYDKTEEGIKEANRLIALIFENGSLYQRYDVPLYFYDASTIHEMPFNSYCKIDNSRQTFMAKLYPKANIDYWEKQPATFHTGDKPRSFSNISFIQQYKAVCSLCQKEEIDIIVRVNSDEKSKTGLSMTKIGQYPAIDIKPEKEIYQYLTIENKEYYRKALICLTQSYGIAAYAYLRRIVENEIKAIVKDLIDTQIDGFQEIDSAFKKYLQGHQMQPLIDIVGKNLPNSFKISGDNPLSLLYQQASGGIHDFGEEICLNKAKSIDILLKFVVKKINEEKNELKSVREAMKELRK